MSKRVKIFFAIGIQLAVIASIGDYVGWPYMKYVLITALIFLGITFILFIGDNLKD
jgi:hypothetical protein